MPLLGRLFAKKTKASHRSGSSSTDQTATPALESPTAASDSNHSSRTLSSYISPDRSIPSYPNAKNLVGVLRENGPTTSPSSASSSSSFIRLRLFGRKKSSPAVLDIAGSASDINSSKGYNTPQRPADPLVSSMETASSDLRRLRPPPSRSAIFAAYADSGSALSTRSLPEDPYQNSDSSPSLPSPQKRPSLFGWTKSTSSLKSPDDSSDSVADSSFNLKSFRHIRAPSPPMPDSPNGNGPKSTPISRPRGSSVHSDTSQRISVAAFREAQARRSNNASPISSPRDVMSLPPSRTRTPDIPHLGGPKTSRSSAALLQGGNQRLSSAIASTTDEDSSSGDDSDNDSVYKGGRNVHLPPKAKSDSGHGSTALRSQFRNNEISPLPRAPMSHLGHSPLGPSSRPVTHFETRDIANRTEMFPRSHSSLGVYNDTVRKGASASGSSLRSASIHKPSASIGSSSTATARKVSPIQNHSKASDKQQPKGRVPINPPPCDTDSDSDDDAPLAALVPPRRPGSAMSTLSNPRSTSGHSNITTRSVNHPKPLIDVKELIASKPTVVNSTPPSDAAFTQGPTLLANAKMAPSTAHGSSKSASGDNSPPLTRKTAPVKFDSPPSPPKKLTSPTLLKPNLEKKPESKIPISTAAPLQRGAASEEQLRDPINDRLTRAVKKSMTNPSGSVQSSSPLPSAVSSIASNNPASGVASPKSPQTPRLNEASRIVLPRTSPPILRQSEDYSPPDEDLAQLLGTAGIKFISRNGESPEDSSDSENSAEEFNADKRTITPIPIKQRSPPPSFTVTSRPPLPGPQPQKGSSGSKSQEAELAEKRLSTTQSFLGGRQRSSSLVPSSSAISFPSSKPSDSESNSTMSTYLTSAATDVSSRSGSSNRQLASGYPVVSSNRKFDKAASVLPPLNIRQRSTTMVAAIPSPQKSKPYNMPDRAFVVFRENSPPSSTGDSSSGRVPRTPRDGSDLGTQEKKTSTLKKPDESAPRRNAHVKRRSVSFEDDVEKIDTKPASKGHIREVAGVGPEVGAGGRGRSHVREGARLRADDEATVEEKEKEEKRKERRRKEAKAAIELGNVIHGPPPVLDDDNDVPVNQTVNASMTTFNTLMNMGNPMAMPMGFGSPPSGGWLPNMNQHMLSPAQFMVPQPADPNVFAAHQRAMMFAKQAYQMAVGQQAMAAAADEWERGSALGGFSGSGNIFGGSPGPSMVPSPFGMMPSMMQGMQAGSAAGWSNTASVYGGMEDGPRFGNYPGSAMATSSQSDFGGPAGGPRNAVTWAPTRSVYGGSFGPSADAFSRRSAGQQQSTWNGARESVQFSSAPTSQNMTGQVGVDFRGPPRSRTASQPASPSRSQLPPRAPPPSSWRQAGS